MFCLVFVGQAFAAIDCATGTGWGDYLTKSVTKTGDYYEISTPEELAWISCKVRHSNSAFANAKVKLTQSIDMQGKVFIPIAAGDKQKFSGTIDGQGFTISNLYINGSEINNNDTSSVTQKPRNGEKLFGQNIGLVGVLNGGTIKNLTLKDARIYAAIDAGTTGNEKGNPISVGTLVGWVDNASTIENCVASGSIETSGAKNRVGGIVGNVKNITITNCVSSVSVTASGDSTYVGGIVGALRNGGTVNMSSCVYSGNSLYTVDGSVGAIAGSYESVGSIKTEDLFYSDDFCENLEEGEACSGIGLLPNGKTFNADSTDNLNSEDVVCNLNGGTWNEGVCTGDSSKVWSVGQSNVSMNGSDGYKITFNANGGSFASGAKTSKVLVKNATITADEIGVPTREGKKFAGWATTANAGEPSDLGVVNAATIIYAVWYDFYQVTFNTGCDTAFSDAKFPDSTKTKTISVAKHGTISVDGFSVPTVYEIGTDENKVKYYFTGWAYAPKSFDVNDTVAETDTLHLSAIDVTAPVTLYAVWTKAPTFSVTFDASLHGKTDVHFVRMVTEGETVSRPDTVITDDGYKVVGWCEVENCTEENEYSFADSLKGNLVLHARWEIESYSINYELNGGTNASTNLTTYNVNSGDIVFAAPTKEGSKFEGWFYDANLTNPATQIDSGSTGDKTIYAKWTVATYTIQYLSGTAISATVPGTTKTYGDTITLRDAPSQFAVGGCTFDGWSKVDYGQEGYAVDYAFGAKYADNANLKLFPHWVCNTYKITYEVYGVEVTNRNDTSYTGPYKVTLQNAFVSGDPVKMDNWYLEPTFKTSIRYLQGIDKDTTLYAKWYNTIIYNPGSRLKAVNSKLGSTTDKKFLDSSYTFKSSIKDFVLTNYTLDGWSTTDGGEKVYELGETYTTNANLTLYPHWIPEAYPIVYHNIEGATFETPNPETYTVEDELPIDLNSPSKPGYNFLGWSLTENSTEYVDGIAAGSSGEANFYANWEKVYPFLVNDFGAIKVYEDENGKLTAEIDGMSTGDVSTISPEDNVLVSSINFSREFPVNETESDKMYSTIVLPFSIDKSKVPSADFYELKAVDVPNKTVEFWSTKGTLQANTPYIIRTKAATLAFNLDEGETVALNTSELNNSTSDDGKWEFRGTYSYIKWNDRADELGRAYGFRAQAENSNAIGSFARIGSSATTRPFRAYLLKVANQQARRYTLAKSSVALNTASIGEETVPGTLDVVIVDRETEQTTAIGTLDTATGEIKMIDNWFDMKGRKLNSKPTAKGIYYYNGKRVMVK
ncbi:InlB B-repeat-containing protein [Fibrobacter sp. UWR2]|uniref:InlB B-repeat-containing protein n=1 Tax=Fibrobacter sp. UWR2 TaxID=1964352 RepID=UPI0013031D9D|nr:InlB B-repeat-containing protein [Fibrobacter sp. UWR2]